MKEMQAIFVLTICLVCVASAPPPPESKTVPPVKLLNSYGGRENDGSYKFGFETDDGYTRDETIKVINEGTEDRAVLVSGSYKYIDPDGVTVEVQYTADQNGFYPVGSHIPDVISQTAKDVGNAKNSSVR